MECGGHGFPSQNTDKKDFFNVFMLLNIIKASLIHLNQILY